ncbi:14979_t:CDS:2 [Acaulospora morrowiae]|uniref:14979_t:CDS:1 n=1 Tax=Acaulospora morrowiae TaxID=94023 RepID=A0A9N9BKS4_9GLOM|nr:14979_t:CDS:2 [Acaulospora morrowiae]
MATEKAPETSSASKSDVEVFQLETLSLNYLQSQNISTIPDDNNIPKLHPCKLFNKAILNFRFKAFTVLCSGIELFKEETALASGECGVLPKSPDKGVASQQLNVTITDEDDNGGFEIMRSMGLIEEDEVTAEQTKQVNTKDQTIVLTVNNSISMQD